jgi:putative aminopeptidase FrvX
MNIDFNRVKTIIMDQLQEYSSISSLTGHEEQMVHKVSKTFLPVHPLHEFYSVTKKGKPYCAYITSSITPPKYVLVTHLDRVCSPSGKPYNTLPKDYNSFVTGQLDDIIGIAIAYYVYMFSKQPVSVLFTTREEVKHSWHQIKMFLKAYSSAHHQIVPIGIDIDIFKAFPVMTGTISLRRRDEDGDMCAKQVSLFQKQADHLSIPWTATEGMAITEIGALARYTKNKLQGIHIGLPLRNYHTDDEEVQWAAVFNVIKLIISVLSITSSS